MKRPILVTLFVASLVVSCSDDSSNEGKTPDPGTNPETPGTNPETPGTNPETPGTNPETPGTNPETPGTNPETPGTYTPPESEIPTQGEVEDGKCVDSPVGKTEPGECGCSFADKDMDGDNKVDCPVRVIPKDALIPLEDIPGTCAEWEYPKHPEIELPDLPEFGYEVTIDTEKYNISKVYDPDKATETTNGFNQAFKDYTKAGYTRIVVPPGHYPINANGISLVDHMALIMGDDVILQKNPINSGYCRLISPKSHTYIEGGKLIGDVIGLPPKKPSCSKPSKPNKKSGETDDEYNGRLKVYEQELAAYEKWDDDWQAWKDANKHGGDECNGMDVWHDHVYINGVKIESVYGDGIMILDYSKYDQPRVLEHVIVANSDIRATRNGIALVGTSKVRITNNHIHHTGGLSPACGIDMEPNGKSRNNQDNIIDHNYFEANNSGDIFLHSTNNYIEYNTFDQGDRVCHNDNTVIVYPMETQFLFYRNKIKNLGFSVGCWGNYLFCPYFGIDYYIPEPEIQPTPNFFVENEIVPKTTLYITDADRLCLKDNIFRNADQTDVKNQVASIAKIRNLRLINNRVENFTAKKKKLFWLHGGVYGKASGNIACTSESENKECWEDTSLNEMTVDKRFDN